MQDSRNDERTTPARGGEADVLAVAYVREPYVVRAAARLAGSPYHGLLQLWREGDDLKVVGSDTHVALVATVKANFEGWPERPGISIDPGCWAQKVAEVARRPFTLTVESRDGALMFECSAEVEPGLTSSCRGPVGKPRDISSIEEIEGDPSDLCVSWDVIKKIHWLAKRLRGVWGWDLRTHGSLRAFELVGDGGRFRIVAMPCRSARSAVHADDGEGKGEMEEGNVRE